MAIFHHIRMGTVDTLARQSPRPMSDTFLLSRTRKLLLTLLIFGRVDMNKKKQILLVIILES